MIDTMPPIRTSIEAARKCGYRQEGGYYLVAPQLSESCSRLPMPLDRCPACGGGIGPSRAFTWIVPAIIVPAERHGSPAHNAYCPLGWAETDPGLLTDTRAHRMGSRAGLIWVGVQHYPTPADFLAEAAVMGISRRVQRPPRGFEIGRDWIVLGHPWSQHPRDPETYGPAIISTFRPTALEYIVAETDTLEELAALHDRGIGLVKVVRA